MLAVELRAPGPLVFWLAAGCTLHAARRTLGALPLQWLGCAGDPSARRYTVKVRRRGRGQLTML